MGLGRYETFKQDLKQGQKIEDALLKCMIDNGWKVRRNNTWAYDLAVFTNTRFHLVEVKDESNYADSGNIAVEMYIGKDKRKSGILKSDANVYIHYLAGRCIVYRKTEMLQYILGAIQEGSLKSFEYGKGDDHVEGVLLRISDLDAKGLVADVNIKSLFDLGLWK